MPPSRPPALLQIAPNFAAQPIAGAPFRNFHLGARLARHMDVTHTGFLPANFSGPAPQPPADTAPNHRFVAVPRLGAYRLRDLAAGVLGRVPFSVLNYTRAGMRSTIARLFDESDFDVVLLEGVHLGEYVPQLRSLARRPAVVCDWHNVESEILRRYSRTAANPLRRVYAWQAARKLEGYEHWFVNQCDLHVTVSARDRDTLVGRYGARVPVVVVENGVPLGNFPAETGEPSSAARFRVLYVGSMDYHANSEAVMSFAREVWPQVRAAGPGLVFTVVGRDPDAAVCALSAAGSVEVTGTVPDVRPYYREALAAVVPLRVGGGTRIKILEAMAAGVPVVSTALGAEGLAAVPGEHYLLADSSREMAGSLARLRTDPALCARLSAAGRDWVRRHDWDLLGDQLARHLLALCGQIPAAGVTSNL